MTGTETGTKQDTAPRCMGCGKMLAVALTRPWVVDCPRCKMRNEMC